MNVGLFVKAKWCKANLGKVGNACSLGKMTVLFHVAISALRFKAKGIANSKYYCALVFPWAFVFVTPIRNHGEGGCPLGRDFCILWSSHQSTTL